MDHGANDQDSNVLEYGDNDFHYDGDEHHVGFNDHDEHIYHGDNDHNDGVAPLHFITLIKEIIDV